VGSHRKDDHVLRLPRQKWKCFMKNKQKRAQAIAQVLGPEFKTIVLPLPPEKQEMSIAKVSPSQIPRPSFV
jgi:hypothetical protein